MTVTILIPVYGVEKYIVECAESLFSQTYTDIEYVFCDDCSTDRSMEKLQGVVERFPERREHVRIVRNDENKGLGGTRVRLVSEVHTDTFLIVDSDDKLPVDAVEKLVSRMKETDTDIVDGGYAEYRDSQIKKKVMPSHLTGERYLRNVMVQNMVSLRVWGRLYKSSVLSKLPDIFIQDVDFAEDICASSRLAAVASRSWTDAVVYYYRVDNFLSYTQNITKKNLYSYFRACATILAFYHQRGHLPLALEVGMLNVYRECRRSSISMEKADEIMQYVPEHFSARVVMNLFRNQKFPLTIADYIYRLLRTCCA